MLNLTSLCFGREALNLLSDRSMLLWSTKFILLSFVFYMCREYGCSRKVHFRVQCSLQSALQSAAVATSAAAFLLFAPASEVILPACGVLFGFLYISYLFNMHLRSFQKHVT